MLSPMPNKLWHQTAKSPWTRRVNVLLKPHTNWLSRCIKPRSRKVRRRERAPLSSGKPPAGADGRAKDEGVVDAEYVDVDDRKSA